MSKTDKKGVFIAVCIGAFIASFAGSAAFKLKYTPKEMRKYKVKWDDSVGTVHTDFSYGEGAANKFDLYLPADNTKEKYGLVVYLHAGGFTTGDKSDDKEMLQWLCSKGYVAAGINYTLRTDDNDKSIYTQSIEIKESMPFVVEEAAKLGYDIDRMAISGGSAGGCLALIYAYRDAETSPVPVKMVFEAVGPSSFYPDDWKYYGFDKDKDAAAKLFSVMVGKELKSEMFGTPEYDELVKDVSPILWVNKNTVPTVMAYGKHDKFQPYEASVRLDKALSDSKVPHEYFVCEHSGHGLQNDTKEYSKFMAAVEEYLDKYMTK